MNFNGKTKENMESRNSIGILNGLNQNNGGIGIGNVNVGLINENSSVIIDKHQQNQKYSSELLQQQQQQQQQHNQKQQDQLYWGDRVMEHFNKANLFVICCIAAGLLLIAYLAAFSCEVSWLLEAKGDLPFSSYMLCAGFFIMFVATTILIHGLVTGLSWGLFSWSIIIGILSIPELAFVMIMTTQYWGLQSTHGLTELISYLIRLVINSVALICVIPTGLKWRRERQVLMQLQTLAARLQLQTPPPTVPSFNKSESQRSSVRRSRRSRRNSSAFDNPGYLVTETNQQITNNNLLVPSTYYNSSIYGSQNEFNASCYNNKIISGQFGHYNGVGNSNVGKRSHSLMDLRCTLPGLYNPKYALDEVDSQKFIPNNLRPLKPNPVQLQYNDEKHRSREDLSILGINGNVVRGDFNGASGSASIIDPIYSTINEPKTNQKLSRNCISLENLGGIDKVKNDLSYGNNLLQNYQHYQWSIAVAGFPTSSSAVNYHPYQHLPQSNGQLPPLTPFFLYNQIPRVALHCGGIGYGGYTNPFVNGSSGTNSKQSLGQESDDYRKYRDVAL
ncbi:uncharacterized protein LOC129611004 [Condylostylus longicornis]|uniref:uncharacterized protein LOC129611004 n=1 Tax=Condylostylus longicornis TaxID=2530218 RepID=UPI00244DA01D|nr:uncharacterized protein LOC129611004 [Condylostylus longicornis]